MKVRCEHCLYWDHSVSSVHIDHDNGLCRIDPPRVELRANLAVWPFTKDVDWCGRFDPDPMRVDEEMEAAE